MPKSRIENSHVRIPRYHMPAEWESHEATWIGWPQNLTDWPGKFAPIPWVYGEIARKVTEGEVLRILVDDMNVELKARRVLTRVGVDKTRVEFFRFPTNRGWTRDSGPIFVRKFSSGERTIARFNFSAWAKYPNWQKDCKVPGRVSTKLHIPSVDPILDDHRVILEGGSIDVNGKGTLLTTEECLLDPNIQIRNSGFTKGDYEEVFREYLGATNVLWLGRGIAGDDTHGHVDDLCRFVSGRTIVLCSESNSLDDNYLRLEENKERVQDMRLEDGTKPEIVLLPMPSPLYLDKQR